jgi:hypothetical protein
MIAALPEKTNRFGFFGHEAGEVIDEQQLSAAQYADYVSTMVLEYLLC